MPIILVACTQLALTIGGLARMIALQIDRLADSCVALQSWGSGAHANQPQATESPADPEGADGQGAVAVQ